MQLLIGAASGPWSQIASVCFLACGLFADLLIVRLMLTLAYISLMAHALAGFPAWPHISNGTDGPFLIGMDMLVWSALTGYVHGSSLLRLLFDERYVQLREEEEEVWRMFYRRSRISRLLFKKQILPSLELRRYEPGDLISGPDQPQRLHVILQGRAYAKVQVARCGG